MFRILFVLFIIIPIIEISVIIQVGALIGPWPTVAIVILSAWLGAKYVRQQGLATLQSVQTKLAQGELPSNEIVTGVMLLVAGVLLVTPGFVTDLFGLSLLIPRVRSAIAEMVQKHLVVKQASGFGANHESSAQFYASSYTNTAGNTYEHEAEEVDMNAASRSNTPLNHHQGETLEGDFQRKD